MVRKAESLLILFTFSLCLFMTQNLSAKSVEDGWRPGWYAGVDAGAPFGAASFSSFGHDRTRPGWSAGVHAGYGFNEVLSLDAMLGWGRLSMSARSCCEENSYWLGSDGSFYYAPVLGMSGWNYADIRSSVFMQKYGVGLNVNVLGFIHSMKNSRWLLEVSPQIAACGMKPGIRAASGGEKLMSGSTFWRLGYGASLRAGYRITERIGISLSSGVSAVAGRRIDGMPRHDHRSNMIWENSVRLSFSFGSGSRLSAGSGHEPCVAGSYGKPSADASASAENTWKVTDSPSSERVQTVPETDDTPASVPENRGTIPSDGTGSPVPEKAGTAVRKLPAPAPQTVYFAFDSWTLEAGQTSGLQEILDWLKGNEDASLAVDGWSDRYGSDTVNRRISLLRAESVRDWFVGEGIDSGRITVVGHGVDRGETVNSMARKAVARIIVAEK